MITQVTEQPLSPRILSRPLLASLFVTGWIMLFVCRLELTSRLSWRELLIFAPICLLLAACIHTFVVWIAGNISDVNGSALRQLLFEVWVPVMWLPLLMILGMEKSFWVAAFLPLVAWLVASLLRQWNTRAQDQPLHELPLEGDLQSLFHVPAIAQPTILPTMVVSLALQLGILALLREQIWLAGALFALGSVIRPSWLASSRVRLDGKTAGRSTPLVFLLILLALTPFLKPGPGATALARLLALAHAASTAPRAKASAHKAKGYSGIILLTPPKPREVVAPVPQTPFPATGKPRDITFDGAYWYFQQPDTRPEPNARVAHGTPLKNHILSTDRQPLVMEAHQPLGQSIPLSCCRSVRINVTNADDVPGTIAMEILLRDVHPLGKTTAVSLGTLILPTSKISPMPLNRPPVPDTLTFTLPHEARDRTFNEITVRIKPEHNRALAGAQVAIKNFILQP